ncbi:MAG: hypothetical protein WDZ51_16455 [Pirellulaceae bacterium]
MHTTSDIPPDQAWPSDRPHLRAAIELLGIVSEQLGEDGGPGISPIDTDILASLLRLRQLELGIGSPREGMRI